MRPAASPAAAGVGPAGATARRTSARTLVAFSLPVLGIGSLDFLIHTYLLKYATDVLLMAPAVLGAIFFVGRIWDAFSDPLVGYLSDRTQTRWGRRRPWLAASMPPLLVLPYMVWAPPVGLAGLELALWLAVGLIGFETVSTLFNVPHAALGAELSPDHHDRTRIFGSRHVARTVSILLGGIAVYAIIEASDKRGTAGLIALCSGAFSATLIGYGVARLREPREHLGRGPRRVLGAVADLWRNRHARLLAVVFFIELSATGSLTVLGPYYMQYVLGDESLFPLLLLSYLVPAILFVPMAVRISQRLGKKRAWLLGMGLSSLSFGGLFFATEVWQLMLAGVLVATGMTIGQVVGPSVQADVIDWDEHATGERKEGAYYAIWNFIRKCSSGFIVWLAGVSLQLADFQPNAEQTEATQLTIRALFAGLPCATYAIGLLIFSRFRLTESEHRRIRAELDARPRPGAGA